MKKNKRNEDEIWEELRYWLKNPVTAVEQAQRDKEEREYINSVMDRMWGEDSRSLNTSHGPLLQGRVEKVVDPYELIQQDETLSKEQKVAAIQAIAEQRNKEIDKENSKKLAKLYGGAALELGSALIPGTGGLKVTQGIAKAIAPKVGRKIAKEISSGMTRGTISGAVEGVGRGMVEDKNPIKTAMQDSAIGFAGGALAGAVGGNVQKMIKGKSLEKYKDIDELDSVTRKEYDKASRKYYQDYIQETDFNKDGKINFSKRGIQELLRWNPQQARNLPQLKSDIKNANTMYQVPNKKLNKKPFVDHYEIYKGQKGNHLIEVNNKGERRYYTTKDTPNGTPHATSTGSIQSADNIITHQPQKLNSLQEWLEELKRRRGHK